MKHRFTLQIPYIILHDAMVRFLRQRYALDNYVCAHRFRDDRHQIRILNNATFRTFQNNCETLLEGVIGMLGTKQEY